LGIGHEGLLEKIWLLKDWLLKDWLLEEWPPKSGIAPQSRNRWISGAAPLSPPLPLQPTPFLANLHNCLSIAAQSQGTKLT
jgi:hypothetical protein